MNPDAAPQPADELRRILRRIDGRGYKAYKDIAGAYRLERMTLYIDRVQGDPFAAPSLLRLRLPASIAAIPPALHSNRPRRIALEDFLARAARRAITRITEGRRGSGKSGAVFVDAGGQEVLERTAAVVTPDWVELRIAAGLPAAGRRILGREAAEMLLDELPRVAAALEWNNLPQAEVKTHVECVENQEAVRAALAERNLVAFIADNSILPRESGASDRPLSPRAAVPFTAPDSLRVTIPTPNPVPPPVGDGSPQVTGMGIPRGVTLIVGGGFHGKSTLLEALSHCVYPHVPGDGREYVVTSADAVKIRAEDGRRVENVDISPFISHLPGERDTRAFSTDNASGSTSQAANIIEALEVGTTLLLVDEDTSATNFMVRDARMQALVHKENEPITPFIDRVHELHRNLGVSTILVMGGSGDYFDVADLVIMMREYEPHDVTADARRVASEIPTRRRPEHVHPFSPVRNRIPLPEAFDPSRGRREVKIDVRGTEHIRFGRHDIDLRLVEQIADTSQARAVGYAVHLAATEIMDRKLTLRRVLDTLDAFLDDQGLDALDPFHHGRRHPGDFARPRRYEIAAAINRLRTVRMRQAPPS